MLRGSPRSCAAVLCQARQRTLKNHRGARHQRGRQHARPAAARSDHDSAGRPQAPAPPFGCAAGAEKHGGGLFLWLAAHGFRLWSSAVPLIRTESLRTKVSVAGKRNFQGRDKEAETASKVQGRRCRDKISLSNPANSGLIAENREISVRARVRGGPGRTRTANQIVMKWSRRSPSAAWLGAYATAPGDFFGHSADTKSHPQTSACASITSA